MDKPDTTVQELQQALENMKVTTVVTGSRIGKLGTITVAAILALFDTYASQREVAAGKKQLYFADAVVSSYHMTSEQLTQIRNRIHDLDSQLTQESEAQNG